MSEHTIQLKVCRPSPKTGQIKNHLNSLLIKPVDVHHLFRGDRVNMMKPRNLITQFVAENTDPPS